MRKPPTQEKMSDPSWAGYGKPNYEDDSAESVESKPKYSQLDIGEPLYIATRKRYQEYR